MTGHLPLQQRLSEYPVSPVSEYKGGRADLRA